MTQPLLEHLQHARSVHCLGAEHPVGIEPGHQQAGQKPLTRGMLPAPQDRAGQSCRDAGGEQHSCGAAMRARDFVQRTTLEAKPGQSSIKVRQTER